jgi:DNA-binding beta-propeller fold protein YncE
MLATAFAAVLLLAPGAQAAESIYWDNYSANPNSVGFANIDGSGGGPLNLAGATLRGPEGMAYDPVTNRLFVASYEGGASKEGEIEFVNLDGSGAGVLSTPGAIVEVPEGIAVDPVSRIVYWANDGGSSSNGSIGWARIDGSAGGVLNTTGATVEKPYRLALDPVAGRVYWANSAPKVESISYANVNESGGGNLNLSGAIPPEDITGLSVDPAGGRIYWLDNNGERISFASLGGGNGGEVNLTGAVFKSPYGLALDPSIGRLYWANYGGGKTRTGVFGFASTSGGGGGISIPTAPVDGPQDPVILKVPAGTEAPKATRSSSSRSALSCSTGVWGADFPGSFVYRSPRAFAYQWTSKGKAVKGATAASFQAKSVGKYACVVTASNQAGSASQTSAAVNVKAAKVKLTTKKKATTGPGGVAKFKLKAVNQGDLKAGGASVCVKVAKKDKSDLKAPKCKSLGGLKGRGKRAVTLKVKVGQSAGGTYPVTFLVRGGAGISAKAKILVH